MNSAPIEFHKIWIDQCLATEGIRERFGLDDTELSDRRETVFLPARGRARSPVRGGSAGLYQGDPAAFSSEEIRDYLDRLENTKYLAPPDPDLEMDELDDPDDEPRLENPVMGAEELLRFSRVRQLLEA
jgi:hypothetical protein